MRNAFIKALEELAARDPRVNLIVGDLGYSVVEGFAARLPKQFLNSGVAEQNMTGLAAGMALSGKIVFTYSIANFPTLRCLEQVRNDVCYHGLNVKIVSVGGGFAYGALGMSHQGTEDFSVLRAMPGLTIVAPGDPLEAAEATRAVAAREGPCYLRLGKAGEPAVHKGPVDFKLGRALKLADGKDLTLISTGAMLKTCAEAAAMLKGSGLRITHLSMHTLKPLDEEAVLRAAAKTGAIMTVEEHRAFGGLGGAVAEVLAQSRGPRVPFRILGIADRFSAEVGSQEHLRRASGLSAEDIAGAAKALLKGGQRAFLKKSSKVSTA